MGGDGDLGLLGFLWCQRESYHLGNGEYRVYIYTYIFGRYGHYTSKKMQYLM